MEEGELGVSEAWAIIAREIQASFRFLYSLVIPVVLGEEGIGYSNPIICTIHSCHRNQIDCSPGDSNVRRANSLDLTGIEQISSAGQQKGYIRNLSLSRMYDRLVNPPNKARTSDPVHTENIISPILERHS